MNYERENTVTFTNQFIKDIAQHEMHVIRDDGVNRHLRFKRPNTMTMHFDLLTWPGHLCYTGDMGTYVFRRLHDMFDFFRPDEGLELYQIDMRYWAEKALAIDKGDGLSKWSKDKFRAEVRDYFDQHADEEWPAERKVDLWTEIEGDVCRAAGYSEHHAWVALERFEHDGFRFCDWESDCREWTFYFMWCCHALRWAIGTYDKRRTAEGYV